VLCWARIRCGLFVALLGIAAVGVLDVGAARASMLLPMVWSSPELVDGSPPFTYASALNGVSCSGPSDCVAVGQIGNALVASGAISGAAAFRQTPIDSHPLSAVSCPTVSLCVAVDQSGDVLWSTDPSGGGRWASARLPGAGSLGDVSCPTTSLCAAVDQGGNVFVSSAPTAGAGSWVLTRLAPADGLVGFADLISCPASTFCVASGGAAVWTTSKPAGGPSTWSATVPVDPGGGGMSALACPSTSLCVGVDAGGNVVTSTSPAGGGPWNLTRISSSALTGVSCPSTSFCAATGQQQVFTASDPTGTAAAWTSSPVDSQTDSDQLSGISCASAAACVAIDEGGDVVLPLGAALNAPGWVREEAAGYNAFDSLSCAPTGLCAAGDTIGNEFATRNPALGPASWVPGHLTAGYAFVDTITGMSCTAQNSCIASDSAQTFVSADPTGGRGAWSSSSPGLAPPDAVCPSSSFCIGSEAARLDSNQLLASDTFLISHSALGPWTPVRLRGSDGELLGVLNNTLSCPSSSLCVALGVSPGSGSTALMTATNPAGGAGGWKLADLPPRLQISALTCPSLSLCVGTNPEGQVTTIDPTAPTEAWKTVDLGQGYLTGISCPTQWFCATAADESILTSTNPTGNAADWSNIPVSTTGAYALSGPLGPIGNSLLGISCVSTALCVSYDKLGQVLVGTGTPGSYSDGSATVGQADLSATRASVPLRCGGQSTASCKIAVALTATTRRHTQKNGHRRATVRTTTVAATTSILRTGNRAIVHIALNERARALLHKRGTIRAAILVYAERDASNKLISHQPIKLHHKPA
jgi:putative hemolysin